MAPVTRHARRVPAASNCAFAPLVLASIALAIGGARIPASADPTRIDIDTLSCRQMTSRSSPAVIWWSPPERDQRERLQRWCDTVGPVVFQPVPAATVARPLNRLAIVTWNLHVGAGDVDRFVARLRAGEFTGGERVDAFVLLLQEAYRRDQAIPAGLAGRVPVPDRIAASHARAPSIDHFWRDDGFAVLYAPSMRNGIVDLDREDRGNAIVSTLPLDRAAAIELPLEHQRRVAVASTVTGTTTAGAPWRVRMVDVHLDTAVALLHGGPFAARRRQADALVAALASIDGSPGDAPLTTVVAGDFNTWGGHEQALDALARAFPIAGPADGTTTFVGPLGFHAALDHVFAAGARHVDIRRLPERYGSDHYPLLAIVEF
jgi:endonuclease/exonuclease/phosphatase family metal-dependent hydrolase